MAYLKFKSECPVFLFAKSGNPTLDSEACWEVSCLALGPKCCSNGSCHGSLSRPFWSCLYLPPQLHLAPALSMLQPCCATFSFLNVSCCFWPQVSALAVFCACLRPSLPLSGHFLLILWVSCWSHFCQEVLPDTLIPAPSHCSPQHQMSTIRLQRAGVGHKHPCVPT